MKPLLRIAFTDFWQGFNPADNVFHLILGHRWRLELSGRPDLVVHSEFGRAHLAHDCHRLCFAGEPWYPQFQHSDLALSPHRIDHPRHCRLPLWAVYAMGDPERLLQAPALPPPSRRPRFASILIGHTKARRRIRFFEKLHARRPVCSAGRALNNIGGPIPPGTGAKREFLEGCAFNIAFENTPVPGYVTEKIMEPLAAGCIPVYWGAPDIARDFNPACFIDVGSFPSDEACIDHLLTLADDPDRLDAMACAPRLAGGVWPEAYTPAALCDVIERMLAEPSLASRRGPLDRLGAEVMHSLHSRRHALACRLSNRREGN